MKLVTSFCLQCITASGSMLKWLLSKLKTFKVKNHVKEVSKKLSGPNFEMSGKCQGQFWLLTAVPDES